MSKTVTMVTSEHCKPCRMAKGFFEAEKIPFKTIDIGEANEDVKSVPTIVCTEGKNIAHRFEGFSLGMGNKIKQWMYHE